MTLTKSKPLQSFTDRAEFDSSAVFEAFYDEPSSRLFVVLTSGKVCGYEGVSSSLWNEFIYSSSAGRFWNQEIKRNRNLKKLSGDVDFVEASVLPNEPEVDLTSYFDRNNFAVQRLDTSAVADTGINLPPANRVFLVTVEVEAPNLGVAVNDVVSQGLEVVAVNPR